MDVKELERALPSEKMPGSDDRNYPYHIRIPTIENMEDDECCTKRVRQIAKLAFCFIPWCALVIIFIYFAIHYDMLHKSTDKCMTTLRDKSRNESISKAQIGELKQKNVELIKLNKEVQRKLEQTEEKYANAQDKIDLYIKTIKELKNNLNLEISSDFFTTINSASRLGGTFYFVIMGLSMYIYIFNFKSYFLII